MIALFNSIPFLIGFAAFLILYAFCPERFRQYLLLAGSVVFMAANSWQAALFALLFAAVNYVLGICVFRTACKKPAMFMAVAVNAAALITFKLLDVEMLGLSYYLFSFMAYLAELAKGSYGAVYDPIRFANFSFFFPKFIQGPITRYEELSPYLSKPRYRLSNLQHGLEYFFLGFAMKILLVDKLGAHWSGNYYDLSVIGYDAISTKLAWLGAVTVSLKIFLDWQAYTFMAMGIAGMLGYRLPQNFNYPYMARTVGDYYRRWHMTLTRWFKDYIYIPLGGNRKGLPRTIVNILLVWCITALWHARGMSPKYLLWGLLFAAVVLGDTFWTNWIRRKKGLRETDGGDLRTQLLCHVWLVLLIPITLVLLWKPASGFNFILWGMTIGGMIVLERLWKRYVVEKVRFGEKLQDKKAAGLLWRIFVSILAHIWVVIPIMLTWVMFQIRDFDELKVYFSRLFPKAGASAGVNPGDFARDWWSDELKLAPYVFVGILFCFPIPEVLMRRVGKTKVGSWIVSILLAGLFWYAVYQLRKNGSDPMGYAGF